MAVEHQARLDAVTDHGHETRSFFLSLAAPLAFRPGQFLSCLLPLGGETLIRPYSIASDPEDATRIELLLDRVPGGPGSAHLFGLARGATVHFTGPWGTFTLDRAPDAPAIFIADGTGIAPVRPMVRRVLATSTGHPVRLLYASPLVYQTELDTLAGTYPHFAWHPVSGAALVAEVTRRFVDADADRTRRFFVCGVGTVVRTLRDLLRHAGYERRAVQYETW